MDVSMTEFKNHIEVEEANQRIVSDALAEGNIRMQNIEAEIAELSQDLKPLRNIYHAVIGAGTIAALLLALILYIYGEDKNALKQMAEAVQKQGTAIEKLIMSHQELEKDTKRELEHIEKTLLRFHGKEFK